MSLSRQLTFIKTLKSTIKSGISLDKFFAGASDRERDKYLAENYKNISNDLKNGGSLAEALEKNYIFLNPLIIKLVKIGEMSGSLEKILCEIEGFLVEIIDIKKEVIDALKPLIYPFIMALLLIFVLFFFLIPAIHSALITMNAPVPVFFDYYEYLCRFLFNYSIYFLVVILLLNLFVDFIFAEDENSNFAEGSIRNKIKIFMSEISLNIIVFGGLYRFLNLYIFFYAYKTCYSAGLSVYETSDLSCEIVPNLYLKKSLHSLHRALVDGNSMKSAFEQPNLFEGNVLESVEIAEETGEIEYHFEDIIRIYKENIEEKIMLIKDLPPLIIKIISVAAVLSVFALLFTLLSFAFSRI